MLGQWAVGRNNQHQFVMAERYRHNLAALGGIGDHAQVDLAFDQVLVNLVRAQIFQMHVDRRVVAQVLGEVRRQFMESHAIDGADPDRSGDDRADFAQPVLKLQEAADDFLAGGVKQLAGGASV